MRSVASTSRAHYGGKTKVYTYHNSLIRSLTFRAELLFKLYVLSLRVTILS